MFTTGEGVQEEHKFTADYMIEEGFFGTILKAKRIIWLTRVVIFENVEKLLLQETPLQKRTITHSMYMRFSATLELLRVKYVSLAFFISDL